MKKTKSNYKQLVFNRMTKWAGADDFFRGVKSHDAEDYLQYDDNTAPEDMLEQVYRFSLSDHLPSAISTMLFLKYPSRCWYSLFILSNFIKSGGVQNYQFQQLAQKYLGYVPSEDMLCDMVWKNMGQFREYQHQMSAGVWSEYLPSGLPDRIYSLVVGSMKLATKPLLDIFSAPTVYPHWLVEQLKASYPDVWNNFNNPSLEDKYPLIQNLLSFPTPDTITELSESLRAGMQRKQDYEDWKPEQLETNKKVREFNTNLLPYFYDYSTFEDKVRTATEEWRVDQFHFEATAEEVTEALHSLIEAKNQGLAEYRHPELPFFYFKHINETQLQPDAFVIYGRQVKEEFLNKLIESTGKLPADTYVKLSQDAAEAKMNGYKGDVDIESVNRLMLINETDMDVQILGSEWEDYVTVGCSKRERERYLSSAVEGSAAIRLLDFSPATPVDKAREFGEWFGKQLEAAKASEAAGTPKAVDHFYLNVIRNPVFIDAMDKASSYLGSVNISGNSSLPEEEYDADNPPHWGVSVDSYFKSAYNVVAQFPPYLLDNVADKCGTWFVMTSGLFPAKIVHDDAMKYPSDALKVAHAIKIRGDDGTFAEKLKATLNEKVKVSKKEIRKDIEGYLQSSSKVQKKKIQDFPELFEYVKQFFQRSVDNSQEVFQGRSEDGTMNYAKAYDVAIERLNELDIFLVNGSDFSREFGEENLVNAGFSPQQVNGFYAPKYSLLDTPCIFVFTNGSITQESMDAAAQNIEKFLGIKSEDNTINFSEENTLWHEVSHYLTGINSYDNEHYQTAAGWITDPSELVAFQYGNLQHMKQRLRTFFNKIFPIDGRLNAGLNEQIKSEIIEAFPIEFSGLNREQALANVQEMLSEYEEGIFETGQTYTKEQQIQNLTNMFSKYFMQKSLRGKFQERLNFDQGKEVVTFPQEIIPPEEHGQATMPNQRDSFITSIQSRPDFTQAVSGIKEKVNRMVQRGYGSEVAPYLYRGQNAPRGIFTINDLIMYMFNPPWSLSSAKESNKNPMFSDLIPDSLYQLVINYAKHELSINKPIDSNSPPSVTPDEAEELGGFVADMDQEYGSDWVWMANNKKNTKLSNKLKANFYKLAMDTIVEQQPTSNKVEIPQHYIPTIMNIVRSCEELGLVPYAVGGFVRDLLMGKQPKDLDIMTYPPSEAEDKDMHEQFTTKLREAAHNIVKDEESIRKFMQPLLGNSVVVKRVRDFHFVPGRVIPGRTEAKEYYHIKATIDYFNEKEYNRYFAEQKQKGQVPLFKHQWYATTNFESSVNPSYLLAAAHGQEVPRGAQFGIYAIKTDVGEVEIAYPRAEQYTEEDGRNPRTDIGNLDEDWQRRDFKMNALRIDLRQVKTGPVVEVDDPTGGLGLKDIQEKQVSVSRESYQDETGNAVDNTDKIFREDPLRLLRAFRQAAQHGFTIDKNILSYVKQHPYLLTIVTEQNQNTPLDDKGFLPKMTADRVRDEFMKVMGLPSAPQTLNQMKEAGVLPYILNLPEEAINKLDMDQQNPHHYETVWDHTITTMQHLQGLVDEFSGQENRQSFENFNEKRMMLNLVALFHDLGKTTKYEEKVDPKTGAKRLTFNGHHMVSKEYADTVMKNLHFPSDMLEKVGRMTYLHDHVLNLEIKDPKNPNGKVLDEKFLPKLLQHLQEENQNARGSKEQKEQTNYEIYDLLLFGMADRLAHSDPDTTVLRQAYTLLKQGEFDRMVGAQTPLLNGKELMQAGIPQGPVIRIVSSMLVEGQMQGVITSKEQAVKFVQLVKQQAQQMGVDMADAGAMKRVLPQSLAIVKSRGFDQDVLNGQEIIGKAKELFGTDVKPGKWVQYIKNEIKQQNIQDKQTALNKAVELMKSNQQEITGKPDATASTKVYWYKVSRKKRPKTKNKVKPKLPNYEVGTFNESQSTDDFVGPVGHQLSDSPFIESLAFTGNPLNQMPEGGGAVKEDSPAAQKMSNEHPELGQEVVAIPLSKQVYNPKTKQLENTKIKVYKNQNKYIALYPDGEKGTFDSVLDAIKEIRTKYSIKNPSYAFGEDSTGSSAFRNDINDGMQQFNG